MKVVRTVDFAEVSAELDSQGRTASWGRQPIEAAERQFQHWCECILSHDEILEVRLLDSKEFRHELGITVGEYCKRLGRGQVMPLRQSAKLPDDRPVFLAVSLFYPDPSSTSDIEGYGRLNEINKDGRLVCLDGAHRLRKWALSDVQEIRAFVAGYS